MKTIHDLKSHVWTRKRLRITFFDLKMTSNDFFSPRKRHLGKNHPVLFVFFNDAIIRESKQWPPSAIVVDKMIRNTVRAYVIVNSFASHTIFAKSEISWAGAFTDFIRVSEANMRASGFVASVDST